MQSTRLIAIAVAGRQQPLAVLAKPSVPESVTRLRRRPRMVAGQIPLREGEAVPTTVTRVALLRREGRPVVEDGAVPTEQLAGRHVLAKPRRELHLEGAHVHAEDRGQRPRAPASPATAPAAASCQAVAAVAAAAAHGGCAASGRRPIYNSYLTATDNGQYKHVKYS